MAEPTPKKKSGFISNFLTVLLLVLAAVYVFFPAQLMRGIYAISEASANLAVKTMTVDGQKIVYADNGRKAPALVLLHGFGANRTSWYSVTGELSARYRLIVADLPGFGESSRITNANYAISNQAARLDGFFSALGISNIALAGNSLGGYLSSYYAATRPAMVSSLILIDPAGVVSPEQSDYQKLLAQGTNVLLPGNTEEVTRVLEFAYHKPPWLPKPIKKALANQFIAEKGWNAKIWSDWQAAPVRLETLLTNISAKSLVIWGQYDRIIDPSAGPVFTNLIRGSSLFIVSNSGHAPQMEKPKETAKEMLDFLGSK